MTPDQLKGFIQGARSIASELKRAPMPPGPPLYESTRAFQAEQDFDESGMPRGVQPGESIEDMRQRLAAEDQRDYIPPITQDEENFDDVDAQMMQDHPYMRDIIIEQQMLEEQKNGRMPQSVYERPDNVQQNIQQPMLNIPAEYKEREGLEIAPARRASIDNEQDVEDLMQDIENLPTPQETEETPTPEMTDDYREKIARAFRQSPEDKRSQQEQQAAQSRFDERAQQKLTNQMMERSVQQYTPPKGDSFDKLMEQARKVIPRSRQARRA